MMQSPPDFKYKTLSYVCPDCRKRENVELPYQIAYPRSKLKKGRWCKGCGAIHMLTYKMKQADGEVNLKVTEFLCNNVACPKRFNRVDP